MNIINKIFGKSVGVEKACPPPINQPAMTSVSDRCYLAKDRGKFAGTFLTVGLVGITVIIALHVLSFFLNPFALIVLGFMFVSGIYTVVLIVCSVLAGIGGYLKFQEQDDCTAAEFYATR